MEGEKKKVVRIMVNKDNNNINNVLEDYNVMDEFTDSVSRTFELAKNLFLAKNKEYGAVCDPLANFRTGALLKYGNDSYEYMYEIAKDYCRKHIAKLENSSINANVEDSLIDVINYMAIMRYMKQEQDYKNEVLNQPATGVQNGTKI